MERLVPSKVNVERVTKVLAFFLPISFGNDQEAAVGSFAQTLGREPGVILEGEMNDTAVGRG